MALRYQQLPEELERRILEHQKSGWVNPYRCEDAQVIRRDMSRDKNKLLRPSYIRDIDKILHCPYYNRYADKTQVFSFFRNDDISRRALHVQLVSQIARNIGRMLGLNLELIEAIALGHDIGHTPFGHAGERILNRLYYEHTNRYFNHNVHSVRVLDDMFIRNISFQTLDGILCHNGEFECQEYRPKKKSGFSELDTEMERAYCDKDSIDMLVPATLEGCVVRLCDMIAYLGKDRQDARYAGMHIDENTFSRGSIGVENAELINNLTVNIVENSYGKDYIKLDDEYYQALKTAKKENYKYIYLNEEMERQYQNDIQPMFEALYDEFLKDITSGDEQSIIVKHHIQYIEKQRGYYESEAPYREQEKNQIVVDYLASMTDDYFIDLYDYLFPKGSHHIQYVSYFEG